jgi:putative intracellular protease/amidase
VKLVTAALNSSGRRKRVLIVVASPAVNTILGGPVGFWASELTHAWYEFVRVGYDIDLVSPRGGAVEIDAMSDPRDESGYSAEDVISMGFLNTPRLVSLLQTTGKLEDASPADYDALYVAGGVGPMFTFRGDVALQKLLRDFYESTKLTAVVCHGTAALLDVKSSDGRYLIEGKLMTGYANSEEAYAEQLLGRSVVPFHIEDEAKKRGANFVAGPAFRPFAVRDGNLITGQQQNSARAAAELLIKALGVA